MSEFENTAIGFTVFQKRKFNPVLNEDEINLFHPLKLQLKHQNNQEIFPETTDMLLQMINGNKFTNNSLIRTYPTSYFWCNDIEFAIKNRGLDGWYNFGNENKKLTILMPNATTELYVLFYKICITPN